MSQEIQFPDLLSVTAKRDAGSPTFSARLSYDATTGRYRPFGVSLDGFADPVKGRDLRTMPMARLIADQLRPQIEEANPQLLTVPAVKTYFKGTRGRKVATGIAQKPSFDKLEEAALVFTLAKAVGDFPVRAVERCFALEYAQAKRWVRKARKLEIIP